MQIRLNGAKVGGQCQIKVISEIIYKNNGRGNLAEYSPFVSNGISGSRGGDMYGSSEGEFMKEMK